MSKIIGIALKMDENVDCLFKQNELKNGVHVEKPQNVAVAPFQISNAWARTSGTSDAERDGT